MIKVDQKTLDTMEGQYPGIVKQILAFDNAELPACPNCHSTNTAVVQPGVIGRTMNITAATTKFKLVLNLKDGMGKYYCWGCESYFN